MDVDEVWLGVVGALGSKVGGLRGRKVDDRAAVAVQQGGLKLLAGETVERCAVAAYVLCPLLPIRVSLELDALAQD